jgi:hypothetical protein
MAMYESDLTKFMRQFLEQNPDVVADQKKGRAIWWDKAPIAREPGSHGSHSPKAGGNEYTFKPLDDKE